MISPLQSSLFLILAAAITRYIIKNKKVAFQLAVASIFWLLIWSQPYSADLLLYPLERSDKVTDLKYVGHRDPDYILVLACYYNTEGDVPEISRWSSCSLQRLVQTAVLYTETKSKVIITGGHFLKNKDVSYSEKAQMFLMSLGVPQDKIITTNIGTNTSEEIISASPLVEKTNLLVVTSATHVLRVSKELQNVTKRVTFFPVDYHSGGVLTPYLSPPSLTALEATRSAFYEYLALVKHYLS